MWLVVIVGFTPRFKCVFSRPGGAKPLLIQALIPDPASKGFHESILTWSARLDELQGGASKNLATIGEVFRGAQWETRNLQKQNI